MRPVIEAPYDVDCSTTAGLAVCTPVVRSVACDGGSAFPWLERRAGQADCARSQRAWIS